MILLSHFYVTQLKLSSVSIIRLCLLVVAAGLLFSAPLRAQSLAGAPAGKSLSVYGGAAITTLGPGSMAGISFRSGGHQLIFRGVSTDFEPANETWEISGLYGRAFALKSFHFSTGAGVGIVGGKGYAQLLAGDKAESFETMIGFPLEAGITWKPVRQAGLGLSGFANINTTQPIGGFALTLHLGI